MDTHRDLIVLSGGVIILIIVCLQWLFAFLRVETVRTDIMIVEWFGVILGSGAAWFAITGAVDRLKKKSPLTGSGFLSSYPAVSLFS